MWPNPQETADLITFTEETFNRKLHFLWIAGYAINLNFFHSWISISLNIDILKIKN